MSAEEHVPRRNATATRAAILVAARHNFSQRGYEHVGVRDIARQAGVNPALVIRYFGSKEQVFAEAVTDAFNLRPLLSELGPASVRSRAQLGDWLMRYLMRDETDVEFYPLLALLRSAPSPQGAALLRQGLEERFIQPLAEYLGDDEQGMRASVVAAILLGLAVTQDIIGAEPLAHAEGEVLVNLVAPVLQRIIDGSKR